MPITIKDIEKNEERKLDVISRTISRADRTGLPPTVLNRNNINVRKHVRKLELMRKHEHLR
ncbi:hypothetical protein PIB30_087654 [Stylosanthes scabra]|uniref:Uncharacterized protein n=1 Tax=Stylosanthes scabra TaxID=79078 RepID=A0ABU6VS61_9FABA|nr:hypothetical protein [Stylosanthes scabra]